jgi:hypothetical protein
MVGLFIFVYVKYSRPLDVENPVRNFQFACYENSSSSYDLPG